MKKIFLITALTALVGLTSCDNDDQDTLSNEDQRIETAVANVKSAVAAPGSVWNITTFIDDGDDVTSEFSGYTFEFLDNDVFIVNTPNGMMLNGTWEVDRDDDDDDEADDDGDDDFYDDIELEIDINGMNPIDLLDDDHEIFSLNDNEIILSDDDSDDDDTRIEVSDLPQAAQDYLTQNHAGVQVCYVEEEDDNDEDYVYEVELVDGTELYFDAAGNLVEQDMDDDPGCDDDNDIDRIVFTRVS